jgi:hypothetical protein
MFMSPVLLCWEDRQLFQVADGDVGGGPVLLGDDMWIAYSEALLSSGQQFPSWKCVHPVEDHEESSNILPLSNS